MQWGQELTQDRILEAGLTQRPWRNTAYCLASHGSAPYILYTASLLSSGRLSDTAAAILICHSMVLTPLNTEVPWYNLAALSSGAYYDGCHPWAGGPGVYKKSG